MKQKWWGYTLLELLIALTLALFLSSAIMSIFIQCKRTYDLTQRLARLQTRARIAFNQLSRDIRMTGLIGCVRLNDFSPLNSQLTPETSLVIWHEGIPTAKFRLPHLLRARFHSDIILIQALDPNTVPVKFAQGDHIYLSGRSLFRAKDKLLISDCQHAEAFQWSHINLQHIYQRGSELGFLDKIIYYIGNTGRRTQEGKPLYALYRRNLNKSLNNPVELVEGIEEIAIRLGVKNGSSGGLIYITPEHLKSVSNVRSLEVNLVLSAKKPLRREWKHIIALRERVE
jgi:type IV pilus assembly protein PilW